MLEALNIKDDIKTAFIRLFALIVKEFYSVWKDPKSRSLIFIPPILQLMLFSHAATLDIENISLAILNEDNTPLTREFLSNVEKSRYFKNIIYASNLKEVKYLIDTEKVRGAAYIKNDFTKKYLNEKNAEIYIILDGRHTNGSQIIGSYLSGIAEKFQKSPTNQDIKIVTRNWYNPNLYYHWFIVSSLAGILPMSMVVLLSALSLAREKESGTFDELLVSPLKPHEILAGKIVIPLFFGVVDGLIILFAAKFFFHLPFEGNIFLYLFALICFLLSVTGIGLFISSISKTQQQAMLGVFVFMFPFLILSGYSAPIENITPKFLQNLTLINPLRFFLVISKGIMLKNINFINVIVNLIPMFFITIVTFFVANFSFKNKLE